MVPSTAWGNKQSFKDHASDKQDHMSARIPPLYADDWASYGDHRVNVYISTCYLAHYQGGRREDTCHHRYCTSPECC